MKYLICILAILIVLPTYVSAEKADELLWSGGMKSILATVDAVGIKFVDQVSDNCLPQPSRMKDKMELTLRQNGLNIIAGLSEDMYSILPLVTINAIGYQTSSTSCVVSLDAKYTNYHLVNVPFSETVPSGDETFVHLAYEIGHVLLSGPKSTMQKRIEEQIVEFGNNLYLEISRAKDFVKLKFPQILEYKVEYQSELESKK